MKQIQTEWTTSQLVRCTGISRQVIEQRLARIKPLRETRRERIYPAPDCFRAIIKARRDDPAQQRLTTAKAEIAEMDLAVKRRELVPLRYVEATWTAHVIAAREIVTQSQLTRGEQDRLLEELAVTDDEKYLDPAIKNEK